jgi:hypothetical protein
MKSVTIKKTVTPKNKDVNETSTTKKLKINTKTEEENKENTKKEEKGNETELLNDFELDLSKKVKKSSNEETKLLKDITKSSVKTYFKYSRINYF